jgi:hypothetical protein
VLQGAPERLLDVLVAALRGRNSLNERVRVQLRDLGFATEFIKGRGRRFPPGQRGDLGGDQLLAARSPTAGNSKSSLRSR